MDYTVTEYREDHREKVIGLHARLLTAGARTSRAYLRWKYEENPFIKSPILFIVRHGEEVVGMRGLFGTCWDLGPAGNAVVLPHADDLIIRTDHRNRGLFLLIHRAMVAAARERGFSALLSLSGGENTQKLSLVAGWEALGELERVYRPFTRGRQPIAPPGLRLPPIRGRFLLRRIVRRLGFSPGRLPSDRAVDRVLRGVLLSKCPNIQISREADLAGMSFLSETVSSQKLRAVRSEDFLRWRLSNPDRRYRFLYWRDSSLRGYMVLGWSRKNVNQVVIADYAVQDDRVFQELLGALGQSDRTEYKLMSSTLPLSHQEHSRAVGFIPDHSFKREQRRRFLFFPLNPNAVPVFREQSSRDYSATWKLGLIDTMGA